MFHLPFPQVGTYVLTIHASDKDNNKMNYGLKSDHNTYFRLDQNTGVLSVAGRVDFEQFQTFQIKVGGFRRVVLRLGFTFGCQTKPRTHSSLVDSQQNHIRTPVLQTAPTGSQQILTRVANLSKD